MSEHVRMPAAAVLAFPLLVLAAEASAGEGGVTFGGADAAELMLDDAGRALHTVKARTYSAEVHRDGRVRLLAGETVLMTNLVLELGRKALTLGDVRREEGDRIALREGEVRKSGIDAIDLDANDDAGGELGDALGGGAEPARLETPDLPGVVVRFLPDGIEVRPSALLKRKGKGDAPPEQYRISGVFGPDAVTVKNLRSGLEDALPTRRAPDRHQFSFYGWRGGYWPEVEVAYRDGTRVTIRGVSGVSHYAVGKRDPYTNEALKGRRGYWSLRGAEEKSVVTLAVRPADRSGPRLPAPYYTVRPGKPKGVFHEDERAAFGLDFAKGYIVPGPWRLDWKIEDHRQRPVAEGGRHVTLRAEGPGSLTVDLTPDKMGFFRARLVMSRADGSAAKRVDDVCFARIRPEHPALRDLDGKQGVDGEMVWANVLGLRGLRLTGSWAARRAKYGTQAGGIDWARFARDYERMLGPAREGSVKGLVSFTGLDWTDKLDAWFRERYPDEAKRSAAVREAKARYLTSFARTAKRFGVETWEPVNEPNLAMSPGSYIENVLKPQYPAVKQGNPGAQFLGGSICGLDNHGWVRRLYELGGKEYFEGISLHPYTGLGFQEVYRAELAEWWSILRDFDDAGHGIWMTESAWHRGWAFNEYVHDRFSAYPQSQALNAVRMILNAEAMRIPRERVYVFYLVEHGYNDFYLMKYGEPTSAAISLQVMNECLRDTRFVEELPLPGNGHHFQLYRDDTRTVAVAFTNGEQAPLQVLTDADEVAVTDLMGNRRTVRPARGRFGITMSGDPAYMVAAPGRSVRPSYEGLRVQPNVALVTLGASAAASSVARPQKGKPALPPSAAISGDWTCYSSAGALTGARRGWDEAERKDEGGKDSFPDWYEVRFPEPRPVARVRVYHDYGAWERTLRGYDIRVWADGEWRTVDSVRGNRYGDVFDHRFAAVTTDRVRVLVRDVNACLFESMSWIPKLSTLRAVEVHGPPEGEAKAFFLQALPRRRVLPPGGEVELEFTVRNVLDRALAAEVRLVLPDGVTSDAPAREVRLPPAKTAECAFTVRLADGAAEGLYTVLAGLYDGDELVSSDHAPRVICCKANAPK